MVIRIRCCAFDRRSFIGVWQRTLAARKVNLSVTVFNMHIFPRKEPCLRPPDHSSINQSVEIYTTSQHNPVPFVAL